MGTIGRTINLEEAADVRWDVIVVGTGMGGATFGYAMSRGGRRVLFCELGSTGQDPAQALTGAYPEEHMPAAIAGGDPVSLDLLSRGGRDINRVADHSTSATRQFIPFIGSGVGGSSALYGMAMERLFPSDFSPRRQHPQAAASTLPERWPVSYDEMAPWYCVAESLFRVRGSIDPLRRPFDEERKLRAPPGMTRESAWLSAHLESRGLHPYRLPMACEFVDGCQGCQGYLCPKACKNDSAAVCLWPAIKEHGAHLITGCRVTALVASASDITGVACTNQHGASQILRGDMVVLAAGALRTPAILLRSASHDWPQGLANRSGLVGRNLMRHCIDLFAIRLPHEFDESEDIRLKQLAFNDFYEGSAGRLGSVQSFGRLPPRSMLFASLHNDLLHSRFRVVAPLLRAAEPFMRSTLNDLERRHMVLASTMEDAPYANNTVGPALDASDPSSVCISYRLNPYERSRLARFRQMIAALLKPLPFRMIAQASNNERIAHACGTCRFGSSPADSVLDPFNRAHGLRNLWVVDASFFPSSGGTNPGLTIAANALRVADSILK